MSFKYKNIQISNDTIYRQIFYIADNIEYQILKKINKSLYFAIQLDELTDISYYY